MSLEEMWQIRLTLEQSFNAKMSVRFVNGVRLLPVCLPVRLLGRIHACLGLRTCPSTTSYRECCPVRCVCVESPDGSDLCHFWYISKIAKEEMLPSAEHREATVVSCTVSQAKRARLGASTPAAGFLSARTIRDAQTCCVHVRIRKARPDRRSEATTRSLTHKMKRRWPTTNGRAIGQPQLCMKQVILKTRSRRVQKKGCIYTIRGQTKGNPNVSPHPHGTQACWIQTSSLQDRRRSAEAEETFLSERITDGGNRDSELTLHK